MKELNDENVVLYEVETTMYYMRLLYCHLHELVAQL
jgi:hypothetical protein